MTSHKIAVLVGSLRADSVNRKLADKLAELAPAGVTVDVVEGLGSLPFYNEDIDNPASPETAPAVAVAFRETIAAADSVLAVTPEYNGTMPAVLNNAIDWASRPFGVGAIKGKPFGVIGVTPTPYGGKWSHEDAQRSARIAGAAVVEDVTVSQTSIDIDVLEDADVLARFENAVAALVAFDPEIAAA